MISAIGNLLSSLGQLGGEGEGGETVVVFTPLDAEVADQCRRFTGTLYVDDVSPVPVPVYDANRDPVDLTALGSLTLHIEDVRGGDVQTATGGQLDIDGSDNNELVFTPDAATVASERTLIAALRRDSDAKVIALGEFKVLYAPKA